MKLRDFITDVLVDIESGVNGAARATNRLTCLYTLGTNGTEGVEFDVAVTASTEASGNVGAEVFSIGAKAEGKMSNERISSVRFRVMVGNYYPKK